MKSIIINRVLCMFIYMTVYFIFLLYLFSCHLVKAAEIIDLGTEGGTCEMDVQSVPIVDSQIPQTFDEPSFASHIENWNNGSYTEARPAMLKPYIGKSVFVFGANDAASEAAAAKVKADLGLCVGYKNLEDLSSFRERTKITFPVQLANDYVVSAFNLKSYPVLVKVKEDTVEYSTDF